MTGFAITGLAYQLVRLRAALRMRREPVAKDVVERHLALMTRA